MAFQRPNINTQTNVKSNKSSGFVRPNISKPKTDDKVIKPNVNTVLSQPISLRDLQKRLSIPEFTNVQPQPTLADKITRFQERVIQQVPAAIYPDFNPDHESLPTTGSKFGDVAADITGYLSGIGMSPGGGARSILGAGTQAGLKAEKIVSTALKGKKGEKIASTAVGGAVGSGVVSAGEAAFKRPEEAGKKIATETALGAVAAPALYGIAKGIGKGISKGKEAVDKGKEIVKQRQAFKEVRDTLNKGDIGEGQIGKLPKKIDTTKTNIPKQFTGKTPEAERIAIVPKSLRPQRKVEAFEFEKPDIEKAYKASKGVKQPSFYTKVKEGISETLQSFTRTFKSLPIKGKFAEAQKELVRLQKIKSLAGDETVRIIDDITKNMDKDSFNLFSRKVLLNDLAQEAKLGNKLPLGFTADDVARELKRLDEKLPETAKKAVEKRKEYWNSIKEDYIKSMKEIGIDVSDRLKKEDYFRHQVLDYVNAKALYGTGSKLKAPSKNRGFLKAREGTTKDINTDYIQAEYEVMAQMKHDAEVAKTIKRIKDNYDISAKVKKEAKDKGLKDWREAIPEGYTTWQPKEGNVFFFADTVSGKVANELAEGILKEAKITADDLSKVLAMGGKRAEYVIPEELADTLNDLYRTQPEGALKFIRDLSKKTLSTWKGFVLTGNPKTVIKYNIRNFTGDLDAIIAGNPGTIKKIPRASVELWEAMRNGKFTPELKDWYDRGGYQSLLYAQEISDLNRLKPFERLNVRSFGKKITSPVRGYFNFTREATNLREAIGRYAAYLDYLEQMKKSPSGLPKNYGASKPEVIKGLKTIEDRAFKLSNDLLGAYDEISVAGKAIREHFIPFFSWMEVNAKRYIQLFKNAWNDPKLSNKVGNSLALGARLAPGRAAALGRLFLKASAATAALSLYNNLVYPDLIDTVPEEVRRRPHIILGKDPKTGETLYFSRLGAIGDFLEWFSLGDIEGDIKDLFQGKKSLKEIFAEMPKEAFNKVANSISPFIKVPFEVLVGFQTFPNPLDPRPIRDKKQYIAQSFGAGEVYKNIAGVPTRPYLETLSDALYYKSDPKRTAYFDVKNMVRKFNEKKLGYDSEAFFKSPKSNALYNYKMALRYNDKEKAKKYLREYAKYGGTIKGLKRSLQTMHPLYGVDEKYKTEFLKGLSEKDRKKLKLAIQYYKESLSSKTTNK